VHWPVISDQTGAMPPSASKCVELLREVTKSGISEGSLLRIAESIIPAGLLCYLSTICGPASSLAHERNGAFYLRRNVNWFYPEERASLLVGQQIQQPVWTLVDLSDSLLELGQQWLAADRQSIRRTEDDAL